MLFALPISVLLFLCTWLYLYYSYRQKKQNCTNLSKNTFSDQLHEMGAMRYEEKVVFIAFISVAILWIFRLDLDLGWIKIPGWAGIFPKSSFLDDGTVAIFVAIVLFILPSKSPGFKRVMDWEAAIKIPWHIILLFGGGFALASGIKESGLSNWFGEQLIFVADLNPVIVILSIYVFDINLNEFPVWAVPE